MKRSGTNPFKRRDFPHALRCWSGFTTGLRQPIRAATRDGGKRARPISFFIMADDLGYGELGCYGQDKNPHAPHRPARRRGHEVLRRLFRLLGLRARPQRPDDRHAYGPHLRPLEPRRRGRSCPKTSPSPNCSKIRATQPAASASGAWVTSAPRASLGSKVSTSSWATCTKPTRTTTTRITFTTTTGNCRSKATRATAAGRILTT